MWVDSHAHLDALPEPELAAQLDRARAVGVTRVIAIGGNGPANAKVGALVEAFAGTVYGTVGLDRDGAGAWNESCVAALERQLDAPGIVAVGECGLDYHYHPESAALQKTLFARMTHLAGKRGIPLIVHSRNAEDDTCEILAESARNHKSPGRLGVWHCFTGTVDSARRGLDLGLHISFSGILTFRNAASIRDAARMVPDDWLLIETDAPYLAPAPLRGRDNEPAHLIHTARVLAEVRSCSLEHLADITSRNAERLFGLGISHVPPADGGNRA